MLIKNSRKENQKQQYNKLSKAMAEEVENNTYGDGTEISPKKD